MITENRQSAAKPLLNEEGSTTIPKGSTDSYETIGKQQLYSKYKYIVYKILCIPTGKFYIGSASHPKSRKDKHLWGLRRNKHTNDHLQNAFNKYGENSFIWLLLEQCNKENLIEREQYWLDHTKCYDRKIGFNISTRAESKVGTKMPESAKIAIGNFWRGKKFSEERVRRLKKERTEAQGKPILVYDKGMNLLYEFCSISETSRQLGISIGAISKQATDKTGNKRTYKTSRYIFRYKDIV